MGIFVFYFLEKAFNTYQFPTRPEKTLQIGVTPARPRAAGIYH